MPTPHSFALAHMSGEVRVNQQHVGVLAFVWVCTHMRMNPGACVFAGKDSSLSFISSCWAKVAVERKEGPHWNSLWVNLVVM